jgi:hypothetical protein
MYHYLKKMYYCYIIYRLSQEDVHALVRVFHFVGCLYWTPIQQPACHHRTPS